MLPVFKAQIDEDTQRAARASLASGWLGMGATVAEFEAELGGFLELPPERHVVAVSTGTAALHLALLAAGVGPGDEVITPAFNNLGDFQAIAACGARPVFCDVDEGDLTIDVESAAEMLGPKVKAVLPLHYMGEPCDERVYDLGLRVVEDACHAVGSRWMGDGHLKKPIGANGDLQCFSFDPIKTMTCIDGGAVVCDEEDAATIRRARLLGVEQSKERQYLEVGRALASADGSYDVAGQGFRYHLANLHAAIGLSQLRHLPEWIENRRQYARRYTFVLEDLDGIVTPPDPADASMFGYAVRVLGGMREALRGHLRAREIDSGVHWRPGHWLTWLRECRGAERLPVSDRAGNQVTTLPLWSVMDDEDQARVVEAIVSFYA